MLKITNKLYIDRLQVFIKDDNKNIGIIADTHIGYIRLLNKKGVHIIDTQTKEIIKELETTNKKKLDLFIINGDFFHEFSKIDDEVIKSAKAIIDFIKKNIAKELIIIKGNHDKIIDFLVKETKVLNEYETSNFFITHGDVIKKTKKTTIIGHEHPALKLSSKTRSEEYKVFLVSKNIIVLPSYNLFLPGHNILEEKFLSPYLKNKTDFTVFATDKNELLDFGSIKNLIQL